MKEQKKTKAQLLEELKQLRTRLAELEQTGKLAQEAGEYAESIVNTVREPLVVLDADLRVVLANRSFYQTFQVKPEATEGQSLYDLGNHQWDIPRLRELLVEILPRNTVLNDFEVEGNFSGIGQRTILLNARLMHAEADRPQTILLAFEDITERRKLEDSLRRRDEKQASAAIEAARALTFSYDIPTGEIVWGGSIEEITGCTPEEFSRVDIKEWADRIHPDDRDEILSILQESMGKERATAEYRFRTKKGYVTLSSISLTEKENGEAVRLVGILQDITERKRMEEERIEAKAEAAVAKIAQEAMETMMDSVVILDVDGKVLQFNRATAEVFGWTEETVGKLVIELVAGRDAQRARDAVKECLEKGFVKNFECTVRAEDEREVPVLANFTLMERSRAKPRRLIGVLRDITERRQAEEERQRTLAALKRSNEELEQFAYVASHDLQEPLRMVSSYTQLLAERYKSKLDTDAREFIDFAVDGANRMHKLINDLLAYSRVTTRLDSLAPTDCCSVLGQALADLHQRMEEANAVITNDDLPTVLGDETQLVRLFRNLLDNGIKFHRDEPPHIHVSARLQGGEWLFSVSDNGIGIHPRHKDRIFTIFQRLHGKREYPGTGVGLAISKRIVERHDGRMWVESEPGQGSIFYFTIPARGLKGGKI